MPVVRGDEVAHPVCSKAPSHTCRHRSAMTCGNRGRRRRWRGVHV